MLRPANSVYFQQVWDTANITLAREGSTLRSWTPSQLFEPDEASDMLLLEHARAGCLVGHRSASILAVTPRKLLLPHRVGMAAYNPSIVRFGGGYLASYR
jgi:hypothetical protein